jgi:hypothetical protein
MDKKQNMKYIKRIETETCNENQTFEIVYLISGPVIVITDERIAIFKTEEGFNSGDDNPLIIELKKNNLNLN